tara:strand:+ start:12930 stop:13154 length:225 start_codon:yes stop_codon:yes gene_type:complete
MKDNIKLNEQQLLTLANMAIDSLDDATNTDELTEFIATICEDVAGFECLDEQRFDELVQLVHNKVLSVVLHGTN